MVANDDNLITQLSGFCEMQLGLGCGPWLLAPYRKFKLVPGTNALLRDYKAPYKSISERYMTHEYLTGTRIYV